MASKPGSSRFALRDTTSTDSEALVELWIAAWRAAMPAIDFVTRRAWIREHLSQLGREGFVIRCAIPIGISQICGFVALSPKLGYLDQIAVHPDHWGKGVGEALIADAKRLAPGGLALDVNQDNPRAIAFYEKNGFRRLCPDRNPASGLPTWWYVWGNAVPPSKRVNLPQREASRGAHLGSRGARTGASRNDEGLSAIMAVISAAYQSRKRPPRKWPPSFARA
jgi:putative acetyltransferase